MAVLSSSSSYPSYNNIQLPCNEHLGLPICAHSQPIQAISLSAIERRSLFATLSLLCVKPLLQVPPASCKWKTGVSFFSSFSTNNGKDDAESLKQELLQAISPFDRGAEATIEDQECIDQTARKLEAANKVKEPLKSHLLNGKWELLYTTSKSILKTQRPKFLRPNGRIYKAINVDTLRAQNLETWPFFNQATANLVPLNARRVAVKFDAFKIAGLIPIKARGSGRGELEITYLDDELRISRGNQGNLFILKMVDPAYLAPL